MKELKIKCWNAFSDIICFEANFYQIEYTFIENKNFEIKPIILTIQRYYLELDEKYLDLKQFKIEISE